ncbi:MAG: SDR family NAD(P)-dependent oxidoreductase [Oribacterium sp.]|nr:SDR family NAD(P)-dependent oxidoreductase [Oribacterium sp.]
MELPFKIDLSGEVAVVTGGTGVIGGMYARALGMCGAKVAVLGRNVEHGQAVVDDIRAAGSDAIAVAGNVLDKASLEAARDEILEKFGHINILVNCAGGAVKSAMIPQDQFSGLEEDLDNFFTHNLDEVHKELDLNLFGTMLPTQVFGKCLVGQDNANIINISSMSAYDPLTRIPGYSSAKAGIASLAVPGHHRRFVRISTPPTPRD